MDLVGHIAGLVPLEQFFLDVRGAGGSQQRRHPVQVRHDFVAYRAGLDVPGPADHAGDAIRALPVGVLLVAEGGHPRVRPTVHVRAVVGAVHDDRVISDAEIVDFLEQASDILVMVDHRIVVLALPPPRLPAAVGFDVRSEVHVGEVHPHKHRLARLVLLLDELGRPGRDVVVDRFHSLFRERAGVLNFLASLPSARQCKTPRGPNFFRKPGKSASFG